MSRGVLSSASDDDGGGSTARCASSPGIGLYPMPELDEKLGPQVAPYLSGQSTAKFGLAKPIPHELITVLVQRLVAQRA